MLTIDVDLRQIEGAAEAFRQMPERLKKYMKTAMVDSLQEVFKHAFDRVHRVSGTLQRSLTMSRPVANAEGGFDGRVGTNLSYARVEEYGFVGPQNVKAHVRNVHGRNVFGKVDVQVASGLHGGADTFVSRRRKIAQGIAYVHPFVRNVNRPEHPYLRPALAESRDAIIRFHKQAVTDAVAELGMSGGG